MCFTPRIAAVLSDTNAGLPVKNGSISTAVPARSSRKAEWPYQVICIVGTVFWIGWECERQEHKPCAVRINRFEPARRAGIDASIQRRDRLAACVRAC